MAARAAEPGQPPTWASSRHSLDSQTTTRARRRQAGAVHGYATRAERYAKQRRLQRLEAELVEVEGRLRGARLSVCRGGRRLARLRHNLDRLNVELTEATRRSAFIPISSGWNCGSLPRWRIYPTRPGVPAPTVWRVRWSSTIGGTNGLPKRPMDRCGTTSASSQTETAGTWMPPGRPRRCSHQH